MPKGTIGEWSLLAGGLLFAIFWGSAVLDVDVPDLLALTIHGVTLVLLTVGLVTRQALQQGSSAARLAGWVGVAVSIGGLLGPVALVALGFLIVGGTAALTRREPVAGTSLALGAAALLIAYALGARYGTEGAADPGTGAGVLYVLGLLLAAIGLVMIGWKEIGRGQVSLLANEDSLSSGR